MDDHLEDPKKDIKSSPSEDKTKKPPKQKRFRGEEGSGALLVANMIKSLSHPKYISNLADLNYRDVVKVLIMVRDVLRREPNLVYCKVPCVIVGDIHGQYADLLRYFEMFADDDNPGYATQRYVFLGDYVDRGSQSLEVIMMVFLLKIKYKKSFHLLRGNHESKAINRVYGFMDELKERFLPDEATKLFHMINEAFTHMPLVCIVGSGVFCSHGGIAPKINSLDEILKIPKPLVDPCDDPIAVDLVWADPMIDLKGCRPNSVRGVSVHFGEDALDAFLKKHNLRMVIRGHQMMMNGFNFYAHGKLLTIFSAASYYAEKANRGAVAHFDANHRLSFSVIAPESPKFGRSEILRRGAQEENDYDTGHILSVDDLKKVPPKEKAVDPNQSVAEAHAPTKGQAPTHKKIRPMTIDPNQSFVETASKPSKNEQKEE